MREVEVTISAEKGGKLDLSELDVMFYYHGYVSDERTFIGHTENYFVPAKTTGFAGYEEVLIVIPEKVREKGKGKYYVYVFEGGKIRRIQVKGRVPVEVSKRPWSFTVKIQPIRGELYVMFDFRDFFGKTGKEDARLKLLYEGKAEPEFSDLVAIAYMIATGKA